MQNRNTLQGIINKMFSIWEESGDFLPPRWITQGSCSEIGFTVIPPHCSESLEHWGTHTLTQYLGFASAQLRKPTFYDASTIY